MKQHAQGFSAIVAVLTIVVVALATLSAYLYADKKAADDAQTATDQQMSEQMVSDDDALNTQRKAVASNLVKGAYDTYMTGLRVGQDQDANRATLVTYTTSELEKELAAADPTYDPVICAQNIPVSLTYGGVTLDGAVATLTVMAHWDDQGSDAAAITVKTDTDRNKITAIMCSQDLIDEYTQKKVNW